MNDEGSEQVFIDKVKQHLDASADDLDDVTAARLCAARLRALDAVPEKRRVGLPAWLLPAGGAATVAVIATSLVLFMGEPARLAPNGGMEDLDLITSAETLELMENLEFYEWLLTEDVSAG